MRARGGEQLGELLVGGLEQLDVRLRRLLQLDVRPDAMADRRSEERNR
jgi:hypothetical protein